MRMKSCDFGALPVCSNDRLIGMITDRDIAVRAVADGRDPNYTQVDGTMSEQLVYCFEDQDVSEAAKLMEENQIRRLPILDRNKRLVGIISLGDIATRVHDEQLCGEVLERVSEPLQQHS